MNLKRTAIRIIPLACLASAALAQNELGVDPAAVRAVLIATQASKAAPEAAAPAPAPATPGEIAGLFSTRAESLLEAAGILKQTDSGVGKQYYDVKQAACSFTAAPAELACGGKTVANGAEAATLRDQMVGAGFLTPAGAQGGTSSYKIAVAACEYSSGELSNGPQDAALDCR
jgi:hypothetical protein